MSLLVVVILAVALGLGIFLGATLASARTRLLGRERFIRTYVFSKALLEAPRKAYPRWNGASRFCRPPVEVGP